MSYQINQTGQTLVEFVLMSVVCALSISIVGKILVRHWNASRCAYFAFEATHQQTIGRRLSQIPIPIEVRERGDFFEGVAQCGTQKQTVQLPKLEATQW